MAFQVFACKSVQKGVNEEPEEAVETMSQTDVMETGTGNTNTNTKAKAGSTETVMKNASVSSNETVKKNAGAGSNETVMSKQGKLSELKEEVITEAEKILTPTVRKAILPSGVGLLILASLMSSKKDRKKRE